GHARSWHSAHRVRLHVPPYPEFDPLAPVRLCGAVWTSSVPDTVAVIGVTLVLDVLASRSCGVASGVASVLYGVMRIFRLGLTIDYGVAVKLRLKTIDGRYPRNASNGSVRDARHAGTREATSDARVVTANANPNASGSRGLTLYSRYPNNRVT